MKRHLIATAASVATLCATPAWSANVFQTDLASITQISGVAGALRAGSIWSPAPPPASIDTLVDGNFLPTGTLWTQGTFWWDQDLNPQGNQVLFIEIQLNAAHTVNRFVIQGDDNDDYELSWWDGAAWQPAYTAAAVNTFGMETRDSGLIGAVTSDRFLLRGNGGDAYYSVSEIQAFDADGRISAPGTLALAGLALAGVALRRRRG